MSKPLTKHETRFRTLVSDLIRCKEIRVRDKEHRLINFWNQSEFYYEVFCESIYLLMTDDSIDALSIDDAGYTRSDIIVLADDYFPGFEILTKEDICSDVDDLIVYVDLALSRLDSRIQNIRKANSYSPLKKVGL